MTDDRWYEFCTPHLQELNPKDDLDIESYVTDMVDRSEAIGSDTLIFMADEGGRAVYPSRLLPMSDHLNGVDLLGMIEERAHARGLRFGAGFLGIHANSHACGAHPDWIQRNGQDVPRPFYSAYLLCPNSPYGRYYADYVREVVAGYRLDILYLEGVYFGRGACYCPYCREQFRALFDRDLVEGEDSAEFMAFRQDSCERFHARVTRVAREISPDLVISGCCYLFMNSAGYLPGLRKHVDICAKENQWGMVDPEWADYPRLRSVGLRMLMLKSGAGKPVAGSWWCGRHVDIDYAPRSVAHARLTFVGTLMYGAAVQPHLQTAFEVDRALMPVLTELNGLVKTVRPYLLDARLLPYGAIYEWAGTRDPSNFCNRSLQGVYDAMVEHHIPFDVINREHLEAGRAADFKVIFLPEALRLSDAEIRAFGDFVAQGGGLVFTGRTGWQDENKVRRETHPLLELAGARAVGADVPVRLMMGGSWDSDEPCIQFQVYYRVDSDDPLWEGLRGQFCSFRDTYVNILPTAENATVQASLYDVDFRRTHRDHMIEGAYPGRVIGPMILTREVGLGRVAYVAADIGGVANGMDDMGSYEVIARLTRWAAGQAPSLSTNAPATVELVTHVKPGAALVFVVNQATNHPGKTGTIRHITPLQNVSFSLELGTDVTAVAAATGQTLDWSVEHGRLTVTLPHLAEYEAVMIKLAEYRDLEGNSKSRYSA